jgi:hypothetical protein
VWENIKSIWQDAIEEEATAIGARYTSQEGEPRHTNEIGTLILVYVNNYRYMSLGERFAIGRTGNAFVDVKVEFRDLQSGSVLGDRRYKSSSTPWAGIFSAMTKKQIRAICKEIVDTIKQQ